MWNWIKNLFRPTYRIESRYRDSVIVEFVKGEKESEEAFWLMTTKGYDSVTLSRANGMYLSYRKE